WPHGGYGRSRRQGRRLSRALGGGLVTATGFETGEGFFNPRSSCSSSFCLRLASRSRRFALSSSVCGASSVRSGRSDRFLFHSSIMGGLLFGRVGRTTG